jgi:NADPH-dependent curcumin reductase CurA
MTTRQWVLQQKPYHLPVIEGENATFKLVTVPLPSVGNDQVLLKIIYFSNDPAQRSWIAATADPERLYVLPIEVNAPMASMAIAEVVESKADKFPSGTLVVAMTLWAEYAVEDAAACTPIQPIPGVSITHFIGAFGLTAWTAYYGLVEIAKVSKDDTVVISAAAGATGSMVRHVHERKDSS